MALTQAQKDALRRTAEREGVDPDELIAAAESEAAQEGEKPAAKGEAKEGRADGRPLADRLLVGFLPFIKVRELREHWLGLPERIDDDELTCGAYAAKHGGGGAGGEGTPPSGGTDG